MATPVSRDNPLGVDEFNRFDASHNGWEKRREETVQRIRDAEALVQKIIDNKIDAPTAKTGVWADELFREVVCRTLKRVKALQDEAEELRIIRKLFSGRA
jgi:hypothetical protein